MTKDALLPVNWLGMSRLSCRHQTQVGCGADLSRPGKTNYLESREMLFDRHEMVRMMTGGQSGIDVIANQNGSAGKKEAVKL